MPECPKRCVSGTFLPRMHTHVHRYTHIHTLHTGTESNGWHHHTWQDKEARAQQWRSQAFSLSAAVNAVAGGHAANVTHCMAFHGHDSVIY